MTVKELKEILDGCNDDAVVSVVADGAGSEILRNEHVFHVPTPEGKTEVIIDTRYDKYSEVN